MVVEKARELYGAASAEIDEVTYNSCTNVFRFKISAILVYSEEDYYLMS